jgi:phosphoribosylamine--glycine ligase
MGIGVLGISYGSRFACIAETLVRSQNKVKLFVVDKQRNPFNLRLCEQTGGKHVVAPELDVPKIVEFAKKYESEIDFGILGPEGPGIDGVRDAIESQTRIKMICPTRRYFIERSKVEQRELIEKAIPKANPRFKVFDPSLLQSEREAKEEFYRWLDEIGEKVAIKPDAPATGKGVGVWGDHFHSREEAFQEYFLPNLRKGKVIVEEKIEGEEFSLQFLTDGKNLIPTPCVRDYKRAFDWDLGPNTGGMGSYKDTGDLLPFMTQQDWDEAIEIAESVHRVLSGGGNPELRGVMYMGYIIGKDGVKVLEINSRWGDPEVMNVLPLLRQDFVEVCFKWLDGKLTKLEFEKLASVVVYATPLSYGGYATYTGPARVRLDDAERLKERCGECLRIYPGAMELREDGCYALRSRTVACVGIGEDLQEAREIAYSAIRKIDGPLRHREDIALPEHIQRSIEKLRKLRETSA